MLMVNLASIVFKIISNVYFELPSRSGLQLLSAISRSLIRSLSVIGRKENLLAHERPALRSAWVVVDNAKAGTLDQHKEYSL
jgi:hypothetical protein